MDLSKALEKTKLKSARETRRHRPPYVAISDRPYSTEKCQENNKEKVQQTSNKVPTNCQQTDNKVTTNCQQSANKVTTKCQQSTNKVTSELLTTQEYKCTFSELVGLQRSIIIFINEECKKARSDCTHPLTIDYISHQVGASKKTLKTSICRLEVKNCLQRKEYKNGRGGWTRYGLPRSIFNELIQSENINKLTTKCQQSANKVTSKLTTKAQHSSSSNITTTTLPEGWSEISLEEAAGFGLTENHLLQLANIGEYEPSIIQDSIQHFLFDLKYNGKGKEIKTNPLTYFMGILKRYRVYASPDNYESEKSISMRAYLEKKNAEKKKEIELEKECFDYKFSEWAKSLSEEEKNAIIPEKIKKMKLIGPKTSFLRNYFRETLEGDLKKKGG